MTKNIREAMQFATRKQAAAAAKVIGWQVRDVVEGDIMGFRLWFISNEHCSYLTKPEFDALVSECAKTFGHEFAASYGNRDYCGLCGESREGHDASAADAESEAYVADQEAAQPKARW